MDTHDCPTCKGSGVIGKRIDTACRRGYSVAYCLECRGTGEVSKAKASKPRRFEDRFRMDMDEHA